MVSLAVGIALALREAGIAERRFAQVRELANTFLFQFYDQATPLAGSTAVRASILPGVGALFLGAGSDLSRSMSVPISSPEVETGFQKVLKACKAHRVGCAISAGSANDVVRRVKEGWTIIRSTVPASRRRERSPAIADAILTSSESSSQPARCRSGRIAGGL